MEKQYFAKYLPKPDGFRRVVKNEQGIPIDYEQEIQLFLCSKDFQIGSIYTNIETGKETLIENNAMLQLTRMQSGILIIKIGEISPDALSYVKEGDEFNYPLECTIPIDNYCLIKGPCGHFH